MSDANHSSPDGFSPPPPPVYPGTAEAPWQSPPTQAYPGAVPTYPPAAPIPPASTAQPQQGQVTYATPGYPVPAARPASGLAITSLVCGIAGLVLFWALIPMLASIAAVITGHMALGQTKRDPHIGGRGMAFAGLILGYVVVGLLLFTIVSTVISVIFVGAFSLPFIFAG